jgi:DNA processing protein
MELEATMQKDLLADFLHLYHSLGPRRTGLVTLLEHFAGDPEQVRHCSTNELRTAGLNHDTVRKIRARQHPQVAVDLAWAATSQNHLVHYRDSAYPELLRQINGYPALLYASGNLQLLLKPQVAIVGSRNCTPGGAQTAFDFAAQLSAGGLVITSGMALGIDSAAHRGALHAAGNTIAVTGTGLDLIYPSANRKLAAEILEQGLIVSEFPLGTHAQPANFPQRNRIISGLSMATLVVEAAKRSGSLITARLAAEQGREVYTIPGSIHNPQTRGCHQLIRDGAMLAETPKDIVAGLSGLVSFVLEQQCRGSESHTEPLDREHQQLLEAIGYDPVNCDILVQRSGLTIDKLSSMLLVLELSDLIQSAPGGCFVRI